MVVFDGGSTESQAFFFSEKKNQKTPRHFGFKQETCILVFDAKGETKGPDVLFGGFEVLKGFQKTIRCNPYSG